MSRRPSRAWATVPLVVSVALLVMGCRTATPPAEVRAASGELPRAADLVRGDGLLAVDATLDELCAQTFTDVAPPRTLRVGLMTTSGSVDDGGFNQFAYEGMEAAARCFGLETTYLASGNVGDEQEQLAGLVAQEMDAVVVLGFALGEVTRAQALASPEVAFIGVDQAVEDPPENLAVVTFAGREAGFLAGAVAGMLTRSGTVAVLTGPEVPPVLDLAEGFERGVAHVADEVELYRRALASFSDPGAGAAAARSALTAGADVVYAPAGLTGSGAISAAASAGRWVIGVDQDQFLTTFEGGRGAGAGFIVTSTVKRVDLAVFLQLADVARGSFAGGELRLDTAVGGITYAPRHLAAVPDDLFDRLETLRVELAEGRIVVDDTDGP